MRYLLIDRITQLVPWKSAAGLKSVSLAEDFFVDHFPERPVMPGVLMIEALAQLSNWLVASSSSFRQGARVVSIGNAKFRKFVSPGTQLHLNVTIEEAVAERIQVAGRVSAQEQTVTQAQFLIVRADLLEQDESIRQRQLFRALIEK